jgi:competence protein ComEA
MKGCTDYTQEARNWVRSPQGPGKAKRIVLASLIGLIAVSAIVLFWPVPAEEGFAVIAEKEPESSAVATQVKTEQAAEEKAAVEKAAVLKEEEMKTLVVYVTGAVANPGGYELKEGDRLNDAIEMAGGLVEGSAQNYINLAAPLSDGAHIHVPFAKEIESGEAAQIAAGSTASAGGAQASGNNDQSAASSPVNINTANATELQTLPGIGAVTAKRIIDYREKYGSFKTIADIKKVSGIGDKKFEELANRICVL